MGKVLPYTDPGPLLFPRLLAAGRCQGSLRCYCIPHGSSNVLLLRQSRNSQLQTQDRELGSSSGEKIWATGGSRAEPES